MNTLKTVIIFLIFCVVSVILFQSPFLLSSIHEDDDNVILKNIVIPSIGVKLPLRVASIDGASWDINEDKTAYLGEGTSYPGQPGTTVIFAHARNGYFGMLPSVNLEDEIIIRSEAREYRYKVYERRIVDPFDTSFIRRDSPHTLALLTCYGPKDSKRLAIFASPTDIRSRID